jgi:hypothetical protein
MLSGNRPKNPPRAPAPDPVNAPHGWNWAIHERRWVPHVPRPLTAEERAELEHAKRPEVRAERRQAAQRVAAEVTQALASQRPATSVHVAPRLPLEQSIVSAAEPERICYAPPPAPPKHPAIEAVERRLPAVLADMKKNAPGVFAASEVRTEVALHGAPPMEITFGTLGTPPLHSIVHRDLKPENVILRDTKPEKKPAARLLGPIRHPLPPRWTPPLPEPPEEPSDDGDGEDEAPAAAEVILADTRPTVDGDGKPLTREQQRSRRHREVRARTIFHQRTTKRELEIGRMLYPETGYYKPQTRGECIDGPRPCPYVSCQHHLYLDVSARTGAIKANFPDIEVWDMHESCALDVADRHGTVLEGVGVVMNLTRERVRQIEVQAFAKIEALARAGNKAARALLELAGLDERRVVRRLPVLVEEAGDDEQFVEEEVDDA